MFCITITDCLYYVLVRLKYLPIIRCTLKCEYFIFSLSALNKIHWSNAERGKIFCLKNADFWEVLTWRLSSYISLWNSRKTGNIIFHVTSHCQIYNFHVPFLLWSLVFRITKKGKTEIFSLYRFKTSLLELDVTFEDYNPTCLFQFRLFFLRMFFGCEISGYDLKFISKNNTSFKAPRYKLILSF